MANALGRYWLTKRLRSGRRMIRERRPALTGVKSRASAMTSVLKTRPPLAHALATRWGPQPIVIGWRVWGLRGSVGVPTALTGPAYSASNPRFSEMKHLSYSLFHPGNFRGCFRGRWFPDVPRLAARSLPSSLAARRTHLQPRVACMDVAA